MQGRVQVKWAQKNVLITNKAKMAISNQDRMIGLMFAPKEINIDGLLIEPCKSIHTFFMKFDLDLVFLNKSNNVVKIIRKVKPWRMTWIVWSAVKVLELKSGIIPDDLNQGAQLEFTCTN